MHLIYRQTCRVCGCPHFTPVVDLGEQYLQGSFLKVGSPTPPLRKIPTMLVRCDVAKSESACGLVQLAHTLPPAILYENYWYRSGTNSTMRNHLTTLALTAAAIVRKKDACVLDIGCNDGTLLNAYPVAFQKYGVDPSDIALEIPSPVVVIRSTFPSTQCSSAFASLKFDIITSIAMFYDLEAPLLFAREVSRLLSDAGVWVVEMSYLPLMLLTNSFDTICHEHLEYYSLSVLERIAYETNLRVFRAEINDINGGSIRIWLCRETFHAYDSVPDQNFLQSLRIREFEMGLDTEFPYRGFVARIEDQRSKLLKLLQQIRLEGKRVHIYGASTKGNVLLQWYGLNGHHIECAADRNPQKVGARTLGTDIPVVSEEESRRRKPDYYLVLPWHFAKEFLNREKEIISQGTSMIFPLPELCVVTSENLRHQLDYVNNEPLNSHRLLSISLSVV